MPIASSSNLPGRTTHFNQPLPTLGPLGIVPPEIRENIFVGVVGYQQLHFGVLRISTLKYGDPDYAHLSKCDHFPCCTCSRPNIRFKECACAKATTVYQQLSLGLLFTSKTLKIEAEAVMFKFNVFTFYSEATLAKFIEQYPEAANQINI